MLEPMPDLALMTTATSSAVSQKENTVALLSRHQVGELVIQSSRLVACDPFGSFSETPFQEPIPTGTHPVVLCIASLPEHMHLVAYAALHIAEREPINWEIAQIVASPIATMPNYFNVESNTACYVDARVLPVLAARFDPTNPADPFRLWLVQELYEREPRNRVGTVTLELSHQPEMNAVLFETGWGNACYRSYIGRDATGTICRLLTDFGVLDVSSTVT